MDLRHPPAEVSVDADLARRLLAAQHPHLLGSDPVPVGEGWDNFIFRVGAEHALRVPRRQVGVELLLHEQRWLPEIAGWIDIAVPVPVAVGVPSELFAWPWSVVRWIEGDTAESAPLSVADAERLGGALRALHRPSPPEAPTNPFRGVPLSDRAAVVEERLARLGLRALEPVFKKALSAPPAPRAVWLHGDLHPRNVLVRDGALVGLIDWGDVTGGDPATDLVCAWTLFEPAGRESFRRRYGPTPAEWARAKGWAVHFGSALVDSGEPAHVSIGHRILEQLAL
ncbi:MAG: aminoglycoside phosphotransferase family protein [Gemmatimonadota bacterium]|jgi:aminoglycoside phosphotransferase (APT) family kinase protein